MKILLSPAKLMDLKSEKKLQIETQPQFLNKTERLNKILRTKSPKKLQELMDVSLKIAEENWSRFQEWQPNPTQDKSLQALLAFKGEVYRGLNAETLAVNTFEYTQENVFLLSGYYGILRPFDKVMPYRLEMGTKLKNGKNKNLYELWEKDLTQYINKNTLKNEPIINLASKEYNKVINRKKIHADWIDIDFKELRNGKYISIMTYFKNARGRMARYCIDNKIKTIEQVKNFNLDNYLFNEKLSTDTHLVFTR